MVLNKKKECELYLDLRNLECNLLKKNSYSIYK